MNIESTEQWKNIMAINQDAQSRTNASNVIYRNEKHLTVEAPETMSPKSWSTQKNIEEIPKNQLPHKFKQYNAQNTVSVRKSHKPVAKSVQLSQNVPKKLMAEPTSEFQAIWNELHKKQVI